MYVYNLTEHNGTTTFSTTIEVMEHLDAKYLKNYKYQKQKDKIEVICNSSVVGVIKKEKKK